MFSLAVREESVGDGVGFAACGESEAWAVVP
jgi:hypothetical protein